MGAHRKQVTSTEREAMIQPTETRFGPQTKFTIFGKSFDTLAEAESHRDVTVERRQNIAGRKLSERELLFGVRDGRAGGWETPGQRVAAENWRPTETPAEPRAIEFEPVEDYKPGRPMPPKQRAALSEAQYWERKAREAGLSEIATDPTRAAAKEYAAGVWEKVAFSPHSTTAQIAKAEQLLKQADHDLTTFTKMADSFRAQTVIAHAERTVAMEQQVAQVISRNSALEPLPSFTPPTTNIESETSTNE
jgi:hypothetical protein